MMYMSKVTGNLCSHIDLHSHNKRAFNNHVIWTFDLLTLGSMHAERLPCTVSLPSSVLLIQVSYLEC